MTLPVWFARALPAIALLAAAASTLPADEAEKGNARGIDLFESKIRPVLIQHCYECHSAESNEVKGGLLVDTRANLRRGGDSGPAVVPGNVADSLLLAALKYESYEMPPSGKLPDEVIADFTKWIEMGAADPRDGRAKPIAKGGYGGSGPLWSLVAPADGPPPSVKRGDWVQSDIDRFVLARLEAEGLAPVADAERLTLLRRLYFDLVGLPPAPEAIDAFLADNSPEALAEVVDQLLASPQFGERWGRHWLDVARYAESNGRDRDLLYAHAWRYRDWVIDAFNGDKPYDRFVAEQVAGDLLPAEGDAARAEQLVATGFLALGPKSLMTRGERFTMDLIDEQIDVVGRALLGLTVSCARCHDHKFDPIPQRDYYALAGVFFSTETLFGGPLQLPKGKKRTDYLAPLDAGGAAQGRDEYDKQLAELAQQYQEARKRQLDQQKINGALRARGEVPTVEQIALRKGAEDQANRLQQEIARLKKSSSVEPAFAMAVRDADQVQDCRLLIRGEVGDKADAVPRGFVGAVRLGRPIDIGSQHSGRLELAQWLTDAANPLVARVAVNRIWLHLFGEGLVRSPDNFGRNGEEPSHPELLDWLARRFVEQGWSTKRLVRQIVLSRVYQLSTDHDGSNYAVDPDNRLLWRMNQRRLEAEALRDALLAAGGRLDLARPAGSLVSEMGDGEVGRAIDTRPLEREFNHRSVYLPIIRGLLPEVLKVFDFAEPSIVVGRRDATNVPAQALYFMNSPFVLAQAEAVARRLLDEASLDDERRIEMAYKLCLSRLPRSDERQLARQYLAGFDRSAGQGGDANLQAWASYCQALLASAEFRYLN